MEVSTTTDILGIATMVISTDIVIKIAAIII